MNLFSFRIEMEQFFVTKKRVNRQTGHSIIIKFESQDLYKKWKKNKIDQTLGITLESSKGDLMFYFTSHVSKGLWIESNLNK
jgi:hypothetical protein